MPAYLSTELGGSANQTAAPTGYKPRATVYNGRTQSDAGLSADEQVFATIGTANLPASGTLVIDLYYSIPS